MKPLEKLGRYDLVRVLGKGAMGTVYEARDPNLDRRVAIKTIRFENLQGEAATEFESRFRTEARSAARLQHANIVSVYDSGHEGETAFLVMEYVEGEDLKHHLDCGTRFTIDQSLRMLADLLAALAYAHQRAIVHRDVKPANLLVEVDGRVKLTDFGVARIQDSGENTRTNGAMVGTLRYMAPEQVQGQRVDARADLFAAGVILYQLLVGRAPFSGENAFAIIHQIVNQAHADPSKVNGQIPPIFDAILARALAKNPDMRFSSASEFAQALREAAGSPQGHRPVPAAPGIDDGAGLVTATRILNRPAAAATVAPAPEPATQAATESGCAKCGQVNAKGARFCDNCGAAIGKLCGSCGTRNLAGGKFCSNCGSALDARTTTDLSHSGQTISPSGAQEAERRQITVLFCDLVGSTSLSHALDPEDLRSAVRGYQQMASEAISFYGGHIAQYLGDGILVYFGYPTAHEDDACRAVSTGLRIVDGLPELNQRLQQENGLRDIALQVRVGIHTGLVVAGDVGTGGRRDQLAIGETPNIAAHMQGLAEPNTVVVTQSTYRLVERQYTLVFLGARTVKGLAQAMQVYHARAELPTQSTYSPMGPGSGRLLPLVGRERETEALHLRWQQVEQGNGHVTLLSGDAGIGKSRLIRDLAEYVNTRPHVSFDVRFSPYHQHSPFHALADLLLQLLGLNKDASAPEKLAGLHSLLQRHDINFAQAAPVLGSLIGLAPGDMPAAVPTGPEERRRILMESVLQLLVGTAVQAPLLLICEDLHWADPSTVELIGLLVDQVPTARILVVLSARPSFEPPWKPRSHLSQLLVEPFTQAQTELLVSQLTGGKTLPPEVLEQIVARADGVPLFAEELIKFVLDSGLLQATASGFERVGALPDLAIPATLQDSLMARLDRLAPLKSLVQLAATLGREFSYPLLRAVATADDATLRQQLAGLVEAELIYQRGVPPKATYVFKHALIQDAAYQALLKSTRRQYHRHIAEVMAQQFPEMVESQPEVLAHHCTVAGLTREAIDHWARAGTRALQRSAYPEAISHHKQALKLVADLPQGQERQQRELALQVALAPSLDATHGVASPEVEAAWGRAWDLCQELGDTPQTFPILMGLRRFYFVRGDLAKARAVAERLLLLARAENDAVKLIETHLGFGVTSMWRGDFSDALVYLQQGIDHFDTASLRQEVIKRSVNVSDPLVNCLAVSGWALWITGSVSLSLTRSEQAVDYARRLQHPISLALALDYAAALREFRGEAQQALALANEGIALCRNHGMTFWLGLLTIRRGWALSHGELPTEGLQEIHAGMELWKGTGAGLARPFLLALLAQAQVRAGLVDEARATLTQALADGTPRGELFYEAELHRMMGDLLLGCGAHAQAEQSLTRALELAGIQGAWSFRLRASTSMARYLFATGHATAAGQLLQDICASSTENRDSADLTDARALLLEIRQ